MIIAGILTALMSVLCCAGSMCCNCFGKLFSCCSIRPVSMPRLAYVVLQQVALSVSLVLMFTLKPAFENVDFLSCADASGISEY